MLKCKLVFFLKQYIHCTTAICFKWNEMRKQPLMPPSKKGWNSFGSSLPWLMNKIKRRATWSLDRHVLARIFMAQIIRNSEACWTREWFFKPLSKREKSKLLSSVDFRAFPSPITPRMQAEATAFAWYFRRSVTIRYGKFATANNPLPVRNGLGHCQRNGCETLRIQVVQ